MECPRCKRSLIPDFGGYYVRRYGVCQDCLKVLRGREEE
tara:strand:- start:847 stop:963 length:117 start_codon:yes stop_codon:yes gene_type:complete